MSKKSKEILYDSEEENTQAVQQEQPQQQEMPQEVNIIAPKPQRAPRKQPPPQPQQPPPQPQQPPPQAKEAAQKAIFQCQLCNKQFAKNYYLNIDEGRCNVKRNIELAKQKQ